AGPERTPARFRVSARGCTASSGLGVLWLIPWPFLCPVLGVPLNHYACVVDFELQVGNQFYFAQGKGSSVQGLYYGTGGMKAAIGRAMKNALANLRPVERRQP